MTFKPKVGRLVLITLGLVIILSALGFASNTAIINETFTIWSDVFSNEQYYAVDDAQLTIINPNQTNIITNVNMTTVDTGLYMYNYTFTTTGEYYVSVDFIKDGISQAIATGSISVIKNTTSEGINMEILLLATIIALLVAGWYIGNNPLVIGSGVLFIVIGFTRNYNIDIIPYFQELLFLLIGITIIFQGISAINDDKRKRK